MSQLDPAELLELGAAVFEPTRLRMVSLLDVAELTVSDLTEILCQSQPRVSRHLKLLVACGVVRRTPEGVHAFFRRARSGPGGLFTDAVLAQLDLSATTIAGDMSRLGALRERRDRECAAYFAANADGWEQLRRQHVADERVEAAVAELVARRGHTSVLDLGTGSGRMLELLGPAITRGVGIDSAPAMLALARQKLEAAGLRHCTVRHGDIRDLGYAADTFDAVLIHQVLHLLAEPARVIDEAARVLSPGGSVIVVDFAPHARSEFHTDFNHVRLGFDRQSVSRWMKAAGLGQVSHETLVAESAEMISISIWEARDRRNPRWTIRREESLT